MEDIDYNRYDVDHDLDLNYIEEYACNDNFITAFDEKKIIEDVNKGFFSRESKQSESAREVLFFPEKSGKKSNGEDFRRKNCQIALMKYVRDNDQEYLVTNLLNKKFKNGFAYTFINDGSENTGSLSFPGIHYVGIGSDKKSGKTTKHLAYMDWLVKYLGLEYNVHNRSRKLIDEDNPKYKQHGCMDYRTLLKDFLEKNALVGWIGKEAVKAKEVVNSTSDSVRTVLKYKRREGKHMVHGFVELPNGEKIERFTFADDVGEAKKKCAEELRLILKSMIIKNSQ